MVNREVDSTSPHPPLSHRELWQRSPEQADLKQRTAMTVRTPDWGSVVEKLSTALKQQAGAARAAALARALEKLRSQQMALDERAAPLTTADREFDRIWYGQCADDEVAPKSVASGT
jgi:hypothetical protein